MQDENLQPVKKGEMNEAFDALAVFLFEQYKKKKQADEVAKYDEIKS
jgi:hypothetical protein